jgi:transcriptional regulator with XRE-family HTH domain
MNVAIAEPLEIATSAGGSMLRIPGTGAFAPLGAGYAEPATVSSYDVVVISTRTLANPEHQFVVPGKSDLMPLGSSVLEIRRLSGLTWEELADLMDVSRRSLHHWVNGKPASAEHERRLQRLLGTLRRIDRGESILNRNVLLSPDEGGRLLLDLLKSEQYEEAVERAGIGELRQIPTRTEIAAAARAARTPPAPADLVQAKQDRPRGSNRAIAKKSVRRSKKQA